MRKKQEMRLPKTLFNLFNVLLIMGLIFTGPFSFAQTDSGAQTNQNASGIQEDHDTKKLDKVLQEYNRDAEKVLQDAETIRQMQGTGELSDKELGNGPSADPDFDPTIKKADLGLFDPANFKKSNQAVDLKKVKYSDAMRVALGPLQKMKEKDLLNLLSESTRGSNAEGYIERFPKVALFAVRLVKDSEALPSLARIADDQDKLIRFAGLMISTILVGFFLKRMFKKEGRSVLAALGVWLMRVLIMTSLRFGLLLYFYYNEVEPVFTIASKTFF